MTTIQSGTFTTFGITGANLGLITHPNLVGQLTYPKTWKPSAYLANALWFNPGTVANPVFAKPANGFYGTIGNGTEKGPGLVDSNMTAYKDFQLYETVSLEFRAEFFNVFNHTIPNGPNVAYGASTLGRSQAQPVRVLER